MCIPSVPKTEPFGLLFLFFDIFFKNQIPGFACTGIPHEIKKNPKDSVLGTLVIHTWYVDYVSKF